MLLDSKQWISLPIKGGRVFTGGTADDDGTTTAGEDGEGWRVDLDVSKDVNINKESYL